MTQQQVQPTKGQTKGSTMLMIVFAAFLIPLFCAIGMALFADKLSFSTMNVGTLITPPMPSSALAATNTAAGSFDSLALKDKWQLVYISHSPCDMDCEHILQKLSTVQMALGKNTNEAKVVLITTSAHFSPSQWEQLSKTVPALYWGTSSIEAIQYVQKNLQPLKEPSESSPLAATSGLPNPIVLIDPDGHLMMHYPSTIQGNEILRDLRHLLKVRRG